MSTVEINQSGCAGHARCHAVVEDLFPLDDEGYIDTAGFDVPEGRDDDVRFAARSCPEQIISVTA
ncbi:MAG: ferredoxin [Aeromicrobium sp.]